MNLPDNFEDILGEAAYNAMTADAPVRNANYKTQLVDLGVDSLHAAGVCVALHSLLRDAGVEISQDIVDNAVQSAFADTNTTVGSAVSAVRRNVLSEISLQEKCQAKKNAA